MYTKFTESAECPYHPKAVQPGAWDDRRVDPQELQEAGYLNAGGYGGVTDFEEDTFEEPAAKPLYKKNPDHICSVSSGEAHSSGVGGFKDWGPAGGQDSGQPTQQGSQVGSISSPTGNLLWCPWD